jgi:hypothetical protein
VTFRADANGWAAARTGGIIVSGGGLSLTCTVTQAAAAPVLVVTPTNTSLSSGAISGRKPTINANLSWTAATNVPWLTITDGGSGSGNGMVTFQADANNWAAARTGAVIVSGGSLVRTCTVVQAAAAAELSLSPTDRSHSGDAATGQAISVSANTPWTAASSAGWLQLISGVSGSGNGTVTYQVTANRGPPRTGTITVSGGGLVCVFTVDQAIWIDAYEADNSAATAKTIASGQTQSRSIHAAGNADWVKFSVGGIGAQNLRLETAGAFPYDTEIWLYEASGAAVGYDDENGGGHFSRITLEYLMPGTYYAKILEFFNNGTIPFYTLQASWTTAQPPPPDAYESDNTAATAKRIANGQTQSRTIHAAGNVDWVKFTVARPGAQNLQLETSGSSGDTQMWLYRRNGTPIAYNDDFGTGNFSQIRKRHVPAGTYFIKV